MTTENQAAKKQLSEWLIIREMSFWQNFMKKISKKKLDVWQKLGTQQLTHDKYLVYFGKSEAFSDIEGLPEEFIEELQKAKKTG